jgi:hypothetical protein
MSIPSPVDFLLKTSLYLEIGLSDLSNEEFQNYIATLVDPLEQFETICVECRKNRLFKLASAFETVSSNPEIQNYIRENRNLLQQLEQWKRRGPGDSKVQERIGVLTNQLQARWNDFPGILNHISFFSVQYTCSFSNAHSLVFIFHVQDRSIMKIGQYPSFADLSEPQVEKYRKLLGDERHRDFTRALGLFAHGVGAGSFVYLRRIFEHLLEEAHLKALATDDWDEENFKGKRVVDKIKLLKDFLPTFIVKNRKLYSVLSVGVHTLDDQKCLQHFPLVRAGIELILDEAIRRREEEEKVKTVESELQDLIQELQNEKD